MSKRPALLKTRAAPKRRAGKEMAAAGEAAAPAPDSDLDPAGYAAILDELDRAMHAQIGRGATGIVSR